MAFETGDYVHPEWREALERAGWDRFERVWELEHRWVQPLNRRYGGWGGVARHELPGPAGPLGLYLKVHDRQFRRSARRPLRGRPVLARELDSLRRCERLGIPSPQPVYYAARRVDGGWRSLLATAELADRRPLRAWLEEWKEAPPAPELRDAVIAEVASLLRRLHQARRKVNSFTPDHVFLRCAQDEVSAHLIDLERLEPCLQLRKARLGDLTTLRRTAAAVRPADRLRFLCAYLERPRPDAGVRRLARAVEARLARKLARRPRQRAKAVAR